MNKLEPIREKGERQSRFEKLVPHTRGVNSRDTKRWCRGKVGVEHDWRWSWVHYGFFGHRETCSRCQKHGRSCNGWSYRHRLREHLCICGSPEHTPAAMAEREAESRGRWDRVRAS